MGFQVVHFSNKMDGILREKRVVQGLTQQQVADRAKISLRQYQSFESGERNIRTASFQLTRRVIETLGICLVVILMIVLFSAASAEVKLQKILSDDGKAIGEEYVSESGKLTVGPKGFARHLLDYNSQSNVVSEAYFDENGRPMDNADGFHKIVKSYDEQNRLMAMVYFDASGQPGINRKTGAFKETFGYDEAGNINLEVMLDEDGNRTIGTEGWCEHRTEYNENK